MYSEKWLMTSHTDVIFGPSSSSATFWRGTSKSSYASTVLVPCEEREKWNHMLRKEAKASQRCRGEREREREKPAWGHRRPVATSQRGCLPSNVPLLPDSRDSSTPRWQMLSEPSHRLHLLPLVPQDTEMAAGAPKLDWQDVKRVNFFV